MYVFATMPRRHGVPKEIVGQQQKDARNLLDLAKEHGCSLCVDSRRLCYARERGLIAKQFSGVIRYSNMENENEPCK
jgi:hypothetical protein